MKSLLYFARSLALLWAGFWTFFFVAESLAWHTPVGPMMVWLGVGLVFLSVAVAGWRWEFAGGLLLLVAGVVAALAYAIWAPRGLPLPIRTATLLAFGVPPTVAGALFLLHHHAVPNRRGPHGVRP